MNLATILERSAYFFPNRPAIGIGGADISYRRLNEQANQVATALIARGIRPGDRVMLCAPNSPEWVSFYFGVLKAGAEAVTVSSRSTGAEIARVVADAGPVCIFTTDDRLEDLGPLRQPQLLTHIVSPSGDVSFENLCRNGGVTFQAIERNRGDTAAILFTGGTTGTPKGALLSHENIYSAICNVVFNERSNENDRSLCFLPFNHVFAQMHILNATILSGGCIELIPAFDLDQVLAATAAGRVTKLYAVPTIYVRLLSVVDLSQKLGRVRYCFSAAASMAVELVHQWRQRTGLAVYEAYGMTESASMVTYNHYYRHVIGSVGTPVGTNELRICDPQGRPLEPGVEGEICIRGRNIMSGYLNRPDETGAAFRKDWFRSGDIGFLDPRGYLFMIDRLKDLIITGGENVYPREVEEALYTFPEVSECAVIGLPDPKWGERVTAMIVPSAGRVVDVAGLKQALRKTLSAFKVPKEFRVVDDLPKSPAGKILKRTIRDTIVGDTGKGDSSKCGRISDSMDTILKRRCTP